MTSTKPLKRHINPVPPEGDGGYSMTWWPICLSSEVAPGKIKGADFLGGRVIAVRRPDGMAQVLSAYCPHVGADLCVGDMIDGTVRCAFHHWRYDTDGRCVATGIGDRPPPTARLFKFPTAERYGIVWAFNGQDADWELPVLFPYPDDELVITASYHPAEDFSLDAWVGMANTPDWNHLRVVHHLQFDHIGLTQKMTFTPNSFHYRLRARMDDGAGPEIDYERWVYGTNIFVMYGSLAGTWFGAATPLLQVAPGRSRIMYIIAVRKTGDDSASQEGDLRRCEEINRVVVEMGKEDEQIFKHLRFKPGTLTQADAGLARFLDYVRSFPRAHPSAEFIE
jgi:nitrite reductase/ring-hydroxylating ferredoxin subunit